jgi:hypothetical protein
MALADTSTPFFLTDDEIEQLADLTPFPEFYETEEGLDFYESVNCVSRFNYPYANRGKVLAMAPEYLLEMHGAALQETADPVPVTASQQYPWVPRGQAPVPTVAGAATVLVSRYVPQGYRYWINAYAFNLFPSTSNELNYQWFLRINGQDFLNKGIIQPAPGRPVQSPTQVQIGYTKDEMFLAQPGALIEIVVMAITTLGSSNRVSGAVFGFLESIS